MAQGPTTPLPQRSGLRWFQRHKNKLWWAHSAYGLLLGIGIMWMGARDFTYLRIAVFHVAVIWLISLFLPKLLGHPRLPPAWTPRIRLAANFFSKNLYQQVLFFVLPIYYASATFPSRNFLFVVLVGSSATLSHSRHRLRSPSCGATEPDVDLLHLQPVRLDQCHAPGSVEPE
jgi:hypothetical protein